MRILQYNILKGSQGEPDRRKRLGKWLKNQSYDLVGLNELNGWNREPGIRAFANQLDYPYYKLLETKHSPYYIGVVALSPIEVVEEIGKPFFHGVLHIQMQDIHFIITHLTHVSAIERERETEILAQKASRIKGPMVLMGDLNTLSPLDHKLCDQRRLVRTLNSTPLLKKKFVDESNLLNYRPMQILFEASLIDLCNDKNAGYTVPTPLNTDSAHVAKMRLDYILVNEAFVKFQPKIQVLRDREVDLLSDHYPVECVCNLKRFHVFIHVFGVICF